MLVHARLPLKVHACHDGEVEYYDYNYYCRFLAVRYCNTISYQEFCREKKERGANYALT